MTNGAGHFEVEACVRGSRGALGAEPVGDHKAVEAPFVAQDLGEESGMFGAVCPAHAVVTGHHRPGFRFLDRRFEGDQVNFSKRALAQFTADRVTFEL